MENTLLDNDRKQQLMGLSAGHDENQKPGDIKLSKGVGEHRTSRNALVPVVNQLQTVSDSFTTNENAFNKGNEQNKKRFTKHQESKLPKQKKVQPIATGNQTFQPKFTIYCDDENDSPNNADDNMSLVDEGENFVSAFHSIQDLGSLTKDTNEIPDEPSCSFESLEKSIAVFSDDSFFSCGQSGSGDVGRLVPSENFKEYTWDIMCYLLHLEKKYRPEPDYMSRQPEVNTKMRNILVDWMVEVTAEYKLNNETLFLAVNYIDRFLSEMSIARSHFQLLGKLSCLVTHILTNLQELHHYLFLLSTKRFTHLTLTSSFLSRTILMLKNKF